MRSLHPGVQFVGFAGAVALSVPQHRGIVSKQQSCQLNDTV